jgi:hypothetical protein
MQRSRNPKALALMPECKLRQSDEELTNAVFPIRESLETDSNVSAERESHLAKQSSKNLLTDERMPIEESDLQWENASVPINQSLPPLSCDLTAERDAHLEKQPSVSGARDSNVTACRKRSSRLKIRAGKHFD